ncbi:MAG: hypothetical protein HYW70_01590 [Candidatus Nealsonbacteria bacterium]|nr:hypothetical protein [Candidatus Nealsonbacteria bacterium]
MNLASTLKFYSFINKNTVSLPAKFSLKSFWLVSLILLLFSLAFFIFQILAMGQSSYFIGKYKENIDGLSGEVKKLEISLALENSTKGEEVLAREAGFEPVKKVYYIEILKRAVLTK